MLVKIGKKYLRPCNIQEISVTSDKSFTVSYVDFTGDYKEEVVECNDVDHAIKVIISECNQIEQL